MPHMKDAAFYLVKAEQCLAGAALAVAHGQYNNAANRAYYAAFQAAIAALCKAGVEPPLPRYWAHDFVLREFCRRLARVEGVYSPAAGATLKALLDERLKADYEVELVNAASAQRAVSAATEFVGAVRRQLGREAMCQPSVPPRGPTECSSP
jgi:uncharacterized protein (UPF0332 family)